jgi:hypothetical protein
MGKWFWDRDLELWVIMKLELTMRYTVEKHWTSLDILTFHLAIVTNGSKKMFLRANSW